MYNSKKYLYWMLIIGICSFTFELKAQEVGLVLPLEEGWILNKLYKGEALNINGLEVALLVDLENELGKSVTYQYRGFFVDNMDGKSAMKLLKPPSYISKNRTGWRKESFKKGVLVEHYLALKDIRDIHLVKSKDKPIAVIGDVVGFLGGITSCATLAIGLSLQNSRPNLVGVEMIGYSILGLGLSYLATRIGHSKKYSNKLKRKRKYNHWVIIN